MKRFCFLIGAILAITGFQSIAFCNDLSRFNSDTAKVNYYINRGDYLRYSYPDSSILYYNKGLTSAYNCIASNKKYILLVINIHNKLSSHYNELNGADSSFAHVKKALDLLKKHPDNSLYAKTLLNKGLAYSAKSMPDSGLIFCKKALGISKKFLNKELEAKTYLNIGKIFPTLGYLDSSKFYFNKALQISQTIKNKGLSAEANSSLGSIEFKRGNLSEALKYFNSSGSVYHELKDVFEEIKVENNIANIHFMRCEYGIALEKYISIAAKCEKLHFLSLLGKVYHNIGEVNYNIIANDEAIKYYLKSLKIREQLNDKNGISSDYLSIGKVQISNGNPVKAIEYYKLALSILVENKNTTTLGRAYHLIGDAYIELNDFKQSHDYLLKAKQLSEKLEDDYSLLGILFSLSQLYYKQGDIGKALDYQEKLRKQAIKVEDIETEAISEYNIASYYNYLAKKETNQFQRIKYLNTALSFGLKSFKKGEENRILLVQSNASKELKSAYEGLGNFKKALFYCDLNATLSDSLFRKEKSESAIFAEARWQAERKQEQITFLEQERSLKEDILKAKESENKKQHLIIFLLIGGFALIMISLIVVIYYIRKQRRLELQQQINKISTLKLENARNRLSPHFLFNILSTIQEELQDKPEAKNRLDAIVNMLRSSLLNVEQPAISLQEEIKFVDNYLLLQKTRFNDDLQTEIHIENQDLLSYKIPAMIVQIPVENAIKHGLAGKQTGDKTLKIIARLENGSLVIRVVDNGIGRMASSFNNVKGTGTGLKVISQTLHLFNRNNDKKILFNFVDLKDELGKGCGTKVDISVPTNYKFDL